MIQLFQLKFTEFVCHTYLFTKFSNASFWKPSFFWDSWVIYIFVAMVWIREVVFHLSFFLHLPFWLFPDSPRLMTHLIPSWTYVLLLPELVCSGKSGLSSGYMQMSECCITLTMCNADMLLASTAMITCKLLYRCAFQWPIQFFFQDSHLCPWFGATCWIMEKP